MSLHKAVGDVVSLTVTTATQVLVLPLPSVTVKVTLLAPISAQEKEEVDGNNEAMLQLSVEPLSISDPAMLILPVPSRYAFIF